MARGWVPASLFMADGLKPANYNCHGIVDTCNLLIHQLPYGRIHVLASDMWDDAVRVKCQTTEKKNYTTG